MSVAIFGTKVGMTRVFDGNNSVAVTVVECLPNDIVELKTVEKHGHSAIKVAVGAKRRKPTKPLAASSRRPTSHPAASSAKYRYPPASRVKTSSSVPVCRFPCSTPRS